MTNIRYDIDKTKDFYRTYNPCSCHYCENYYAQIEKFSQLTIFLKGFGVDVLKPWELVPFEDENCRSVDYISCQYIIIGQCPDDFIKTIDGIVISKATLFPTPNLEVEYFVIEFSINLPWVSY